MNDLRPKNPIQWIKYKLLEWQWDRVLHRSGKSSWECYFRDNDPDFYYAGYTVRDQFCGYTYVFKLDYKKLPYHFDPMFGHIEHCEEILDWCDQNCRDKYRSHWVRVIQDHAGQYLPNGIGGTDELFFGFKDERDYIMFALRWE